MDLRRIRERSLEHARNLGCRAGEHLPLLDPDLALRPLEQIVGRQLCLFVTAASAYGFDRSRAVIWVETERLGGALLDDERRFLQTGEGDEDRFKTRIEGLWALAWTVSMVGEIEFDRPCSDRFVEMFPSLTAGETSEAFRRRASRRPFEEVVATADLAYCLHWAAKDAWLLGEPCPVNLAAITERRRALDWVLMDLAWDEVPTDT